MEKTRNETAELAQSTPTHPWLMHGASPTQTVRARVLGEREREANGLIYHSFSWKRMGSRLHTLYTSPYTITKRDATAQHDDDDDN